MKRRALTTTSEKSPPQAGDESRSSSSSSCLQQSPSFNHSCSLHHALLAPARIQALADCDKNVTSYNVTSFLMVFRCRGRHFEMIAAPLLCLLLWDIAWALYLIHYADHDEKYQNHRAQEMRSHIQKLENFITPILTPVSFLLVFRLGRAAVRYWDARAAAGKVVEVCRTIGSSALVGCQPSSASNETLATTNHQQQQRQRLAEDFVRWIAVFPIAVKNFLRPDHEEAHSCRRGDEIGNVLSPEDCELFLQSKGANNYAPILVLNKLRQLTHDACNPPYGSSEHDAAMRSVLFRQLNEQIDTLTGAWGAMERISATPLPFVYVVHLRTFILLYLFLWNLEAIASRGWMALLPLMLASWGLLGIEAAAVECERPFQWQSNHLELGRICVVTARNLAQTMDNIGWIQLEEEEQQPTECNNPNTKDATGTTAREQGIEFAPV